MARDTQSEESGFIRKLIRFRPELWNRIEQYQRREFIKRDTEAIFRLLDQALSAQGIQDQQGAQTE